MEIKEGLAEVFLQFKERKGATVSLLQKAQEKLGYLPEEAIAEVARFLGTSPSEVYGVITFYAQFRTTPTGRNIVRVCRGTACHVRGGPLILEAVERELGIEEGETAPDLEYTLETVACIGACGLAPTMVINEDTYGKLSIKKVGEIFAQRKKGG